MVSNAFSGAFDSYNIHILKPFNPELFIAYEAAGVVCFRNDAINA